MDGARGIHRHRGRLVGGRDRAPALGGVRPPAHRGRGDTSIGRAGALVPAHLHRRLYGGDGRLPLLPAQGHPRRSRRRQAAAARHRQGAAGAARLRRRGGQGMNLLPLVWVGIIALGVAIYVVMDGFDLGIGILFPFARSHQHRDLMMNSVAPVWDGNETWLFMGGVGLLAAFPKAYAILLHALYIPLILMLVALIFRGISFEFRFKAHTSRYLWDAAFSAGSMLTALCQGMTLGAVVQGIDVVDGRYAGGAFD